MLLAIHLVPLTVITVQIMRKIAKALASVTKETVRHWHFHNSMLLRRQAKACLNKVNHGICKSIYHLTFSFGNNICPAYPDDDDAAIKAGWISFLDFLMRYFEPMTRFLENASIELDADSRTKQDFVKKCDVKWSTIDT